MTDQKSILPVEADTFRELAVRVLTVPEWNMLRAHMEKGGHGLAPDTAAKFFELFLNGSDCREIHRLNKAFPYESILWARVRYTWDQAKDEYAIALQQKVREKVVKATLDTTDLITDMLVAAKKKYSDSLKRYIQTGNIEDLDGALEIENLNSLLKAVEGLQKITGQDRVQKVQSDVNININSEKEKMTPETAAAILATAAAAKRNKK